MRRAGGLAVSAGALGAAAWAVDGCLKVNDALPGLTDAALAAHAAGPDAPPLAAALGPLPAEALPVQGAALHDAVLPPGSGALRRWFDLWRRLDGLPGWPRVHAPTCASVLAASPLGADSRPLLGAVAPSPEAAMLAAVVEEGRGVAVVLQVQSASALLGLGAEVPLTSDGPDEVEDDHGDWANDDLDLLLQLRADDPREARAVEAEARALAVGVAAAFELRVARAEDALLAALGAPDEPPVALWRALRAAAGLVMGVGDLGEAAMPGVALARLRREGLLPALEAWPAWFEVVAPAPGCDTVGTARLRVGAVTAEALRRVQNTEAARRLEAAERAQWREEDRRRTELVRLELDLDWDDWRVRAGEVDPTDSAALVDLESRRHQLEAREAVYRRRS